MTRAITNTIFSTTVGHLTTSVNAADNITIEPLQEPDALFLDPTPLPAPDVSIALTCGTTTVPSSARKIFDCGEGWVMYADGESRYVVLQPEGFDTPAWSAAFALGNPSVDVALGERMWKETDTGIVAHNPLCYPLHLILSMYFLGRVGGIIVHAAGVTMNGRAIIAAGESGAGKSTFSLHAADEGLTVLSDDRIVLRSSETNVTACGTPWLGETHFAAPCTAPLAAVTFLERATEPHIDLISPEQALERLLRVVSLPWFDEKALEDHLTQCGDLIESVPSYHLSFSRSAPLRPLLQELVEQNG